jgi:hypothetical protein
MKEMNEYRKKRTRLVMTCRIAVRWKNGVAPMVVPGMRVVIATSFLFDLVAICKESTGQTKSIQKR